MSLGAGLLRTCYQKCLPDRACLRHVRKHATSSAQAHSTRHSTPRTSGNQPDSLSQRVGETSSSASTATSEDPVRDDLHLVPETKNLIADATDDGSFREFRGIMARAGINLPLGIANNFKPDPLLRHQITVANQDEVLQATMTPLLQLSYPDQLRFKWERNKKLLTNISRTIARKIPMIKLDDNDMICPLEPIVPSPVQVKFRNKDELNVATGVDGYPKCVGYFVGRSRDNNILCVRPTAVPNMKDAHKLLASKFEEFLEGSPYEGCRVEPKGFVGNWKGITARSNKKGDLMGIVSFHPQMLTSQELSEEKNRLVEFFKNGSGKECNLTSLFFQACPHSQCSPVAFPFELLFGEEFIIEKIGDLKFRISPGAFFQLNTEAAELLYEKITELIQPNRETILLDVCCGTGTIGMSMASKVDQVIGVERDIMAIRDADFNMGLNSINNVTFYCGPAETSIPRILKDKQYNYSSVSAVMNPGRRGLDVRVINALRSSPQVDRVVYVSCMPVGNAMRNILDLCLPSSKLLKGESFFPTRAVPIDMFPNTDHCELLILFERNRLFYV